MATRKEKRQARVVAEHGIFSDEAQKAGIQSGDSTSTAKPAKAATPQTTRTQAQKQEATEEKKGRGPVEQATLRDLRMRKRAEKSTLRDAIRGATTNDPVLRQAAEALEGTRDEIRGLRGQKQAARRVLRGRGKASALQPKAEAPAAEKKEEPKSPAAQSKARTEKAASAAMGAASQTKRAPESPTGEAESPVNLTEQILAEEAAESEVPLEKSYAETVDEMEGQSEYEAQDASPEAFAEFEGAQEAQAIRRGAENAFRGLLRNVPQAQLPTGGAQERFGTGRQKGMLSRDAEQERQSRINLGVQLSDVLRKARIPGLNSVTRQRLGQFIALEGLQQPEGVPFDTYLQAALNVMESDVNPSQIPFEFNQAIDALM